jgi:hypothetical protein
LLLGFDGPRSYTSRVGRSLAAAVAAGAKYLLTGDVTHFGRYLGTAVLRVVIQRPADFLRLRVR